MFKNYFTAARLFPHIDSMANIIRPHVAADPRKMYTAQQFELNISSDVTAAGGYGTRKPGLKSFINTRQTSLQNQFAALGITDIEPAAPEPANSFALMQNFPNPFNPSTVIVYSIGKSEHIKIEVVDLIGRTIATLVDEIKHEGIHSIRFNAGTITSGVYFYRLITPQAIFTKQIMILK
jgi:hypothetical protein